MPLTIGTRLGPYEIVAPIASGGMGDVYKATDTRLGRVVAVKVLPDHVASDPALRARLEREAQVISSLNHPHICRLYDVGRQDGTEFLVMEYLEGETLAQRLARGPMPLTHAVRTGYEIAEALDKAHRQGIVHRDLKPGNVMLTASGAKLLDFGLAKLRVETAAIGGAAAPTVSSPLTGAGSIIGTFQYMAPEQLEGHEADTRSDIFAFGATLYEMLTGRRAFEGTSQASVIAAILKDDPAEPSSLQPHTPAILDGLVTTCLAKSPDDRWQSAGDVGRQLRLVVSNLATTSKPSGPAKVTATVPPRSTGRWLVATTVLSVGALAAWAFVSLRSDAGSPAPPYPTFAVQTAATLVPASISLSPDGRHVAFVAGLLHVRPVDSLEIRALAGTEGAVSPFWSPDSRHIGFASQGQLKRIPLEGGTPQLVTVLTRDFAGGTWNATGDILFSNGQDSGIQRVAAGGSNVTELTTPKGAPAGQAHVRPWFLPDGRRYLFINAVNVAGAQSDVYVASLDGAPPVRVLTSVNRVMYASGYLLFGRRATLLAQQFDLETLTTEGEPFQLIDGLATGGGGGLAFTASQNGVLAYATADSAGKSPQSRLMWYARNGRQLGSVGEPDTYGDVALSPDGTRIAFHRHEIQPGGGLWLMAVANGAVSQFTFDKSHNFAPLWDPNGGSIVFASNRTNPINMYRKLSNGAAKEEMLHASPINNMPESWTPHHGGLILYAQGGAAKVATWQLPLSKGAPSLLAASELSEFLTEFSPDGRWIAYSASESAAPGSRGEVHVRSFPELKGPWRVTSNGGLHARWSFDGRELYYATAETDAIMAVAVMTDGSAISFGAPRQIIKTSLRADHIPGGSPYDVARDGRLLVNELVPAAEGIGPPLASFKVDGNWLSTLSH